MASVYTYVPALLSVLTAYWPYFLVLSVIGFIVLFVGRARGARGKTAAKAGGTPDKKEPLATIGAVIGIASGLASLIGIFYTPKHFYLGTDDRDALLNGTIAVHARLLENNGTEDSPADSYQCHYSFSPPISAAAYKQDNACGVTVTDLPALFAQGESSPMDLTVAAAPLGWPWEGPEPVHLGLYNIARPEVKVAQAMYALGTNVPIDIGFDGPSPPTYTCQWSPGNQFRPADKCQTTFVVPTEGSALSSKTINVSATVSFFGKKFATESMPIEIAAPPPNLFQIVLDASDRMNLPMADSTKTFFNAARDALVKQIQLFADEGGWLSITGFGDPVAPPNARRCEDKVGSVYGFAAVEPTTAASNLGSLTPSGSDAPLAHAIDRAVKIYRDSRPLYADAAKGRDYVFVIITDGTNQCDVRTLADALKHLSVAYGEQGLGQHYYGAQNLSFVVSKDSPEARLTLTDKTYRENHTILVLVRSEPELEHIIEAIGNLFNKDPAVRKVSCQELSEPLMQLGDQFHARQLQNSDACS